MTTMSEFRMRLQFLSLLLLSCVSFSSSLIIEDDPVVGVVACGPRQIQAFTQFKNEFDTRGCNHSDSFNGVWCDNSTGAVTKLKLRACLSGTLKPDSSLFGFHHIRFLDLSENNFISSLLPSEFGNLNKLEVLLLYSSGFLGQIPSSFSNLTMLSHFQLSHNQLTGSFPLVRNLTKLTVLDLSHNHFSGTIPSSLFTLPFLLAIDLRGNNLNGPIDVSNFSSFSSSRLETLLLGQNQFERQIVEPISKLINLKQLDLSFLNTSYPIDLNLFSSLKSLSTLKLSGNSISPAGLNSDSGISLNMEVLLLSSCNITEFPNILEHLQNLTLIQISQNRINGKVPKWLWKLPRLSTVNIANNSFTGLQGSADILVNSSVQMLYMDLNCFEGTLPNLPLSINVFSARKNNFRGAIPLSICNRSSLALLSLSYNNFTGPIPQCPSTTFMFLDLRKNNLEGNLPDNFYVDASLKTLDVSYNRLTGKLPRSLINCSSLAFVNVDNNRMEDTFPFWLKALPNLQVLTLRSNKFFGPISPSDQGPLGFPELRILHLSDNNFTGSLPPSYFVNWIASSRTMNQYGGIYMSYKNDINSRIFYESMAFIDLQYKGLSMEQAQVLTSFAAIDFSGNRLQGQIPESIGLLKALIALNLSNNAFTGHIPLSFANFTELESLDLSRNQLSGTIPNGLKTLSFLAYINVSHNQLTGQIPQGTQITGQPKSSFEGNAGLCGLPLEETCFGSNAPKEDDEEEEEQVLNWKAVVIGYGPGVLLGLAIAQVIASYKPAWLVEIIGPNKRRNR